MKISYEIKTASFADIHKMLDLAAAEGWNPGLDDAVSFQQIDPQGFFVGYLDNQFISCVSNVKYSDKDSFIGLYIVKPEFRGQGFGKAIWDHAMNYSADQNIGLDGVIDQQENYKKSGFKFAFQNERFCLESNNFSPKLSEYIISATHIPMYKIVEYDADFVPCQRQAFLISWLCAPHAKSLVFYDEKKIKGYGVIRKCRAGYKIGPLFADKPEIADQLFVALCSLFEKVQPIYLDIIEGNFAAIELVNRYKLCKVFSTARMYTKSVPSFPMDKIFGLTTFEVG